MARIFQTIDKNLHGELVVEKRNPNFVDVFFIPPPEQLASAGIDPESAAKFRTKLLQLDGIRSCLTMFPTNTLPNHPRFLKSKYNQVTRITLEGAKPTFVESDPFSPLSPRKYFRSPYFGPTEPLTQEQLKDVPTADGTVPSTPQEVMEVLEELPSGFIKNYDFGLGLLKDYRFIVEAVEALSECTEIVISDARETGIVPRSNCFYISWDDFEELRKKLNRITNLGRTASRSVKKAHAYNLLAPKVGETLTPVSAGRHRVRKLITAVAEEREELDDDVQEKLFAAITENAGDIVRNNPERLAKLQNDIEFVTLKRLIERYTEMLSQKLKERYWQAFFSENPFVLNLAFGYPIIKVQEQASIGGRKFSGMGDRITDFLAKNALTNNAALFEIKTPHTNLFNKRLFRSGIYSPSSDLSGAVNQALVQKYEFQEQIAQLKHNSGISDIESYSVTCCLIIGKAPTDRDQLKSFELFRGNSKDVEIITFDELLKKLEQLRDFLTSEESDSVRIVKPVARTETLVPVEIDDIPF